MFIRGQSELAYLVLCDGRVLSLFEIPFQSLNSTRLSTFVRESSVLVLRRFVVVVRGLCRLIALSKRFDEEFLDFLGIGRFVELLTVSSVRTGFELGERLELLGSWETVATELR